MTDTTWATVAVDRPIDQLFTYRVPPHLAGRVVKGIRVRVPFGSGKARGVVVGLGEPPPPGVEVKDIAAVLEDRPLFTGELLRLVQWVSRYYVCPLGEALAACFPAPAAASTRGPALVKPAVPVEILSEELRRRSKRAPTQARLLARIIGAPEGIDRSALLRSSSGAAQSLKKLVEDGLVRIERGAFFPQDPQPELEEPLLELSGAQREALGEIRAALSQHKFAVFLLYGVTGSGKTEVYIRALQDVVASGGQGLVLVPEIALTPQTFARFRSRLPGVAVLHSLLPQGERRRTLRAAGEGKVKVVIGARSAVFAPFSDLRLIVVDEEHETSFKGDSAPRYHARDVAVMRAKLRGIPVVLGSATPSLESYHNAVSGRYRLLRLPERVTPRGLPRIRIVDLTRAARTAELLSQELVDLTAKVLSEGRQAMFFLNRRGYARIVKCLRCGAVATCSQCSVALVYHHRGELLLCHTCGAAQARTDQCQQCGAPMLKYVGAGTERVVRDLTRRFPEARISRLDRDTAGSRKTLLSVLEDFARGRTDILVGTQMVAKGHDFPGVTLVGIVCADTSLHLPDFRAAERTFQLIHQVAGRAGRGSDPGVVVVQTYTPQSSVIQAAVEGNFEAFAAQELRGRKPLRYPPFGRLARIVIQGKREEAVKKFADELRDSLTGGLAKVLGPAPCPIGRIRGRVRYHLILKGTTWRDVNETAREAARLRPPGGIDCIVDVDPVSFL